LVKQGVKSTLDAKKADFSAICKAAAKGDKPAYLVLDELAEAMGQALAAAINISGAPLILIGGQLQQAGDSFLRNLEAALRRRVVSALLKDIQVRYAALPAYAGAWGAALMALEQAFQEGRLLGLNAKYTSKGE
jgi:predicted NBD/HSP70 family sugar kinase